jgi:hypothetical protein
MRVVSDTDSPDQLQERLDHLGRTIDKSRRQAEEDDLIPPADGYQEGDPLFDAFNPPDPEDVPDRPDDEDDDDEA